jgi:threonylcarbamoyladenosine tRNA methylthiotransferase MtaB
MPNVTPLLPADVAAPQTDGRARRVAITSLGCKVNQAEMDVLARLFRAGGVELVPAGARVDLHVVNTCTVTGIADDKSRKAVRRARRASPGGAIVVTGCAVQVGRGAITSVDPAAHLIGNAEKSWLPVEVGRLLGLPLAAASGSSDAPDGPLSAALPTLGGVEVAGVDRRAGIDRARAFVKVQDGCSFHCTYCIIPRARGAGRSVAPDVVLADVRRALAAGHREIVLTGINIGTYDGGRSGPGGHATRARGALTLADLVRRILAETDVERLRLSSIEPQQVDDDLLQAWLVEGAGRCLPHVHLPLQSGDDGVLRRMGRRYDTAFYARVAARLRAAAPGIALHADVIVGFPTEDEAAWARSVAFIRSLDLAGVHVFRYSERPGTPAARMAGQVHAPVRRARATQLLALAAFARRRFAARAVGSERRVLFEQPVPEGGWVGHAEDHVLVRAELSSGRRAPAAAHAGALAVVAITGVDPLDPERVVGRVVERIPPVVGRNAAGPVPGAVVRSAPGNGAAGAEAPPSGGPA